MRNTSIVTRKKILKATTWFDESFLHHHSMCQTFDVSTKMKIVLHSNENRIDRDNFHTRLFS